MGRRKIPPYEIGDTPGERTLIEASEPRPWKGYATKAGVVYVAAFDRTTLAAYFGGLAPSEVTNPESLLEARRPPFHIGRWTSMAGKKSAPSFDDGEAVPAIVVFGYVGKNGRMRIETPEDDAGELTHCWPRVRKIARTVFGVFEVEHPFARGTAQGIEDAEGRWAAIRYAAEYAAKAARFDRLAAQNLEDLRLPDDEVFASYVSQVEFSSRRTVFGRPRDLRRLLYMGLGLDPRLALAWPELTVAEQKAALLLVDTLPLPNARRISPEVEFDNYELALRKWIGALPHMRPYPEFAVLPEDAAWFGLGGDPRIQRFVHALLTRRRPKQKQAD